MAEREALSEEQLNQLVIKLGNRVFAKNTEIGGLREKLHHANARMVRLVDWHRATAELERLEKQLRTIKVDLSDGSEWEKLVLARDDAELQEHKLRRAVLSLAAEIRAEQGGGE